MAIPGYNFDVAYWMATRDLPEWLEIATDGLLAQDKKRITSEIEAHYAESVAAHCEAGLPQLSAEATALMELGDPKAAALKFRKSHLTESEVKSMAWIEEMAAKPFFSRKMLAVDLMPLAGICLCFVKVHQLFNFRILGIVLLVLFAGFRLSPRWLCARKLPRASLLRGFALSSLITWAAFWVAFTPLFYSPHGEDIFPVLYSVFFGGRTLIPVFRIWNKLRKMPDDQYEPPPCQATAC